MGRITIISSIFALLTLASLDAQRAGVPPQEALALTNASVVNVRTGEVMRSATVLIPRWPHSVGLSIAACS